MTQPIGADRGGARLEILEPSLTLDAVLDPRGGILTWVPGESLAEFNLVQLREGHTRGNHQHPEFTEYFLVVEGTGVMVTRDEPGGAERIIAMSRGRCTRAPAGVPHAFRALTDVTAIALLTKPWRDCAAPALPVAVIPGREP